MAYVSGIGNITGYALTTINQTYATLYIFTGTRAPDRVVDFSLNKKKFNLEQEEIRHIPICLKFLPYGAILK